MRDGYGKVQKPALRKEDLQFGNPAGQHLSEKSVEKDDFKFGAVVDIREKWKGGANLTGKIEEDSGLMWDRGGQKV